MTPSRFFRLAGHAGPAAVFLAFALAAGNAQADIGDFLSRVFSNVSTTWVSLDTAGGQIEIKVRGKIEFTPTEDDVQSLSGRAVFVEKRDGHKYRIDFEEDHGSIKRSYSVDGQPQALDAAAKRWVADSIANFIRETGRNAEVRIRRIHQQGGAAAVLADIDRIQSNHTRSKYIRGLAAIGPLDESSLQQLLAAARKMDSDYELRQALQGVIEKQVLDASHQITVLQAVADMDSSYEQRQIMVALTPKLVADDAVAKAWLEAVSRIDSDYELRTVIETLSKRGAMTPAQLDLAIEATLRLDSDYEQATALTSLLRHLPKAGAAQVAAFVRSSAKIDSDYECSRVLIALLKTVKLDKDGISAVLQAADGIDSDYEKGNVLMAVAKNMPADADLIARYRRAARRLGDYERGQAEKALDRLNM